MADSHQIVEQIRMALHSGDPGGNGRLAALASAYSDACAEAAQRLGRCHRLLQRGLRSEAIQLAESEPNLLDTLAVLDFPERPEWDDLVQMRGLPAAAPIPIEPARLLNEAYAEEDPLQDLLCRHRRLALQRAPLRLRIAVLRQLAEQDPGNPIWAEDLRGFEQVRLLQIQEEATEALRRHDHEGSGRLLAEVEMRDWTEPPPPNLVHSLRKLDAQIRGERARGSLEDVVARLEEAHNGRDPIRGRMVRHEWSRLADAAGLSRDDPIADRAGPALDWLEVQDRIDQENRRHAEAVARLVRALDYPGTIAPEELEQLAHEVQGLGDGMPEALKQRYITRLQHAEAAHSRRRRWIAAGSVAAALLVTGLISMAVRAQARSRSADQTAVAIADLLELGRLDQADALARKIEKADPELFEFPALVEARQRIEAAREKESERALQFDQAMREAQSAPINGEEPKALETARSLARLDTEKTQLDELVRQRASALAAEAARRDEELTPKLDTVAAAVDRVEARLNAGDPEAPDNADVLGSVADAQRTLTELSPEMGAAGFGVRDRARALSDRLDAIRAQMERRSAESRLLGAITDTVSYAPDRAGFERNADLAAALQAYAKAFPDAPRSRAFAVTLRDQPVWDAIAEWDRISSDWRDGAAGVAPAEASVRAERCRQFLVQHPASPDFDRIDAYRRAMEAVSHRSTDGEGALGKLQKLMTDLLVDNLWMVTYRPPAARAPQHYYLPEEPPKHPRSLRYLVGFDGKERTLSVVGDWVERIDVSPQTKLARQFKPIFFQEPARIDWETTALDLIEQVRSRPGMDPLLRVALLDNVLKLGLEGSEPLRAELGGLKEKVGQADVDVNVPWMDPDNREADQQRPKALHFLRTLPDLTPLRKQVLERRAQLGRAVSSPPHAVGWLSHESSTWIVRTGAVVPQSGTLRIATAGDGGHGTWKAIGALEKGRPKLTNPDDSSLAEGRPVFVGPEDEGGS